MKWGDNMTNEEAIKSLKLLKIFTPKLREAVRMAIAALEQQTEINIFDQEETYHNCTVQVLTNSATGQVSVGWWRET